MLGTLRQRLTLIALSTAAIAAPAAAADALVTPADIDAARKLTDAYDQAPPFSFTYDGKSSDQLLPQWNPQTQDQQLDGNRTRRTVTWKDPASGLSVRMVGVRYKDYPAVEWTAYLKNEGSADSKKIDDFQGMNAIIGHAPNTPSKQKRPTWSAAQVFPTAAKDGQIEVFRGWVANWRPMTKSSSGRFDVQGQAPWVGPDKDGHGDTILMQPAQGIEGASDAPTTGKSPAVAFRATADGLYRISGKIQVIGTTGDGVEWVLHNFDNAILGSGPLDAGKVASFERIVYLHRGARVALTMHSRSNPDGDLCRVSFVAEQVTAPAEGDVVVRAEKGSDARDMDYQPLPIGLSAGESVALESAGGRGSDGMAIPYFNFQMPGAGACFAIGWPGQWAATFSRSGDDVRVVAGQQDVHLVLQPGEEIRTPLMAVVAYAGDDAQRGQNIWRRWMIAHNIPRVDGKMVGPFVGANSSHQTAEMIKANEKNQIGFIEAYAKRGIKPDYWWMDAGWYENDGTWVNTGTWKVDKKRFPNGLRAISDYAHSQGVKTIVWFEPERVTPNSELYDEHPDFLLRTVADPNNSSSGVVAIRGASGATEPCLAFNTTDRDRVGGSIHWAPRQLTLHPGPKGEFAVARFVAPENGRYAIAATFGQADPSATTDAHVLHGRTSLFAGEISPSGKHQVSYSGDVTAKKGEPIDFVVGWGSNKNHACDMTSLAASVAGPNGKTYDVAADFKLMKNPNGAWTYGHIDSQDLAAGKFELFSRRDAGSGGPNGWCLLNMGDPTARRWITDRIDSIIKSQGIDVYRQDFNIEPLGFWRANDAPHRQGMTENLYVQGYLKYWDDLLARNPTIYIDSCASGGRRNDLETMRRSVPFLRSDRLFAPTGQQAHSMGIFQWLPLNGTGTLVGKSAIMGDADFGNKVDPYLFRSDMSSVFILASDIMNDGFDYDQYRTLVNQYREFSAEYLGDFYPLTPNTLDDAKWMAWQFNSPERATGMVQAFRRAHAGESSVRLKLRGLDENATYVVTDIDQPQQARTMTGKQLGEEGLEVQVQAQPGAAILRYARRGASPSGEQ
jgi:hypothetical protein